MISNKVIISKHVFRRGIHREQMSIDAIMLDF